MNRLLTDNSQEISSFNWFLKARTKLKNIICCKVLVAILRIKSVCLFSLLITFVKDQTGEEGSGSVVECLTRD